MTGNIDFKKFIDADIRALITAAERELADRESARKQKVLDEIRAIADAAGVDLGELARQGKPTRAPSAPKYRNPIDPQQTWTGRGRQPRWMVDALAAGMSLTELAA